MKKTLITAAAVAVLGVGLSACSDEPAADTSTGTPTCTTWAPSPSTTPSGSTSPSPMPAPAECATNPADVPVGNADGDDGPDCDAEDMLTGDRDCAHLLPPATTPKATKSPTSKKTRK